MKGFINHLLKHKQANSYLLVLLLHGYCPATDQSNKQLSESQFDLEMQPQCY